MTLKNLPAEILPVLFRKNILMKSRRKTIQYDKKLFCPIDPFYRVGSGFSPRMVSCNQNTKGSDADEKRINRKRTQFIGLYLLKV